MAGTPTSRLRTWRDAQGYSLQEVGDLVGLSPSMLSRVERGLRQFRPAIKIKVARRLGLRVADLFDVEEVEEIEELGGIAP